MHKPIDFMPYLYMSRLSKDQIINNINWAQDYAATDENFRLNNMHFIKALNVEAKRRNILQHGQILRIR